jgi:hypothetical protein
LTGNPVVAVPDVRLGRKRNVSKMMQVPAAAEEPEWASVDCVTGAQRIVLSVIHESGLPAVQFSNPAFGIWASHRWKDQTTSKTPKIEKR